jgi:hypothetical protein
MSKKTDWLPTRRTAQLAMAKDWAAVLAVKGAGWEIPMPEVTILNTKIANAQEC